MNPLHLLSNVGLKLAKSAYAPPGCEFNNPLTIAPKKDENGNMTGIRVCLDVRALNNALINDRINFLYQLFRTALESFAGNSIFGEFDLSEAYLQFRLHPEFSTINCFYLEWSTIYVCWLSLWYYIINFLFQRVMSFDI